MSRTNPSFKFLRKLTPRIRRLFFTLGFITLAFIIFSLVSIQDLLAPANIYEAIVNPIPIAISVLGIIATILVLRGKTRLPSYLLIGGVFFGFILTTLFSSVRTYSSVAELLIVIIPIVIAIQALSEKEFTWIVIVTILARSAIQILGTFKSTGSASALSSQTELVAQWASGIVAILFGIYIALNLNNYPFRVKMILVLGILTIVPTAIITSITSENLKANLVNQANTNLVFSSDQLATSVDSLIKTNNDITQITAQDSAFVSYIGQPASFSFSTGQLLPRGDILERVALDDLLALLKRDPANIVSCKLIDKRGVVQLSTNQTEIQSNVIAQDYFLQPFNTGDPYSSPVLISKNGAGTIDFSAPIRSTSGTTIGVLDITFSASILQQTIVQNSNKLGTNVSSMLLDENLIILAHSSVPNLIYKIINPADDNAVKKLILKNRLQNIPPKQLSIQMSGLNAGLQNLSNISYFSGNIDIQRTQVENGTFESDQAGAAKLRSTGWYVVTFVPKGTLIAPVQQQTRNIVFISILISLIGISIALGLTQVLISPILSLTRTSNQIAQGDINASAKVTTQDEIGVFANTFNSMTGRMRDLIGNLEQRVAERTQALERRAVQLQAAADIGSTIARLRNIDLLLRQVTRQISQRFGFYHVGIFLLDERSEYAVLRASNSDGGQRMLARGHKLKVGQIGIVGNVTSTGQARIALSVGDDATYFNNPDLPTTQSEMALPLIVGGNILGALDIQSAQEAAFTQEDITTLKVLADQIAIAIENARLFSENQIALDAAQRAYGNLGAEGWKHLLSDNLKAVGFSSVSEDQASVVSENASPGFLQAIETGLNVLEKRATVLYMPVKIRGQSIGAMRMERPSGKGPWSAEAIAMADALSLQLGAALESARLYSDIRQRADRESTISNIAAKLGSSIRMDSILRTAVEELGIVLGDSEVILQVGDHIQKGKERE